MADAFDLKLDPTTNDLVFDDGGLLQTATLSDLVAQRVRMRLATHEGEWWADQSMGVDYRGSVLVRPFDEALTRALIVEQILEVPGVRNVKDLTITQDRAARTVAVRFEVVCTTGEMARGEVTV